MKERLDNLLVKKGLVDSRTKGQWLIKSGNVLVENKKIVKPGKKIYNSHEIKLLKEFPYVGRGGLKLELALKQFSISVKGKICGDLGSSIGGFTDCLLKHGASKVYAIDTATNLLHPSLTSEEMKEKVIPMLGIDARKLFSFEKKLDICTIDLTFTSLTTVLPNVKKYLKKSGDIIALVKPIFETEFYKESKFEIIQDPNQLFDILYNLVQWNRNNQIFTYGIIKSPISGKEGSIEFLIHLKLKNDNLNPDYKKMINEILK
ncbi:MAG: TlyA family RNA methyltransferase [Promethearchaeota archaeon]